MQDVSIDCEPRTLRSPSAAAVIGELMRMLDGRHEMYAEHAAQQWLVDNDYAYRVGFRDSALTEVKGERFAETIIAKSGIVGILEDFEI
jgi:hypothetical protein